jgi:carbonic anhydrase
MRSASLLVALLCVGLWNPVSPQAKKSGEEWSYRGAEGPSHWGDLKPDYSTCKLGSQQSPIDIQGAQKSALPPLVFDYKPAPLKIINNGHTVQVNYAPGSKISIGGHVYDVVQFHFHHPSEEKIQGRAYDMVAHIVHKDSEGHLAVVAVLLKSGAENKFLGGFWSHLPPSAGPEQTFADVKVNLADLLPDARGYYTFMGSLTTPPCTEQVRWFVLKTPVDLSATQIAAFARLYPDNARPTQPANGRKTEEGPGSATSGR